MEANETLIGPRATKWSDWAAIMQACGALIPAFPTLDQLRPALVPAAPPYDYISLDDADEKMWSLTNSYFLVNHLGSVSRQRFMEHSTKVKECCLWFQTTDARPAAWIAYSMDHWNFIRQRNEAMSTRPSIGWLWSPKRMREQRHRASDKYCYERYEFGMRARSVVAAWYRMRSTILLEAYTKREVSAIVSRYFPDGIEPALEKARREGEVRQKQINNAVASWLWVW